MPFFKIIVSSFSLFLFFSGLLLPVFALSDDVVPSSLTNAKDTLASAYRAAFDAERAGASMSVLLDKLTVGGEYLAESRVWYRLGVFEKTYYFAELCNIIAIEVSDEALELRDEAKRVGDADFVVTLALSVIGVVLSVLLCFITWVVFKRRYYNRVLGSKPEVVY